MASEAQIAANRRNATRSTGPKTDSGRLRVRENALKHGLAAVTIVPFSLQGDPGQLAERTADWEHDVQPRTVVERNLVREAARLTLEIERGELIETQMIGAWQSSHIRELGRRLLYIAGPEEVKVARRPLWADDPGQLVSQLEASAEGCRWLMERWQEYRNLLDRKTKWEIPEMLRFIRLQGKNVIESTYDAALNSLFLAWDVVDPEYARKQWGCFQQVQSSNDPALNHRLVWREIADRPSDPDAAWALLAAVVEQHEGQLKQQLAVNEVIEAGGDPGWADRAAFEGSPGFERLRRSQSARRRELMRTLDELRKMRNAEFGMRNGEKADDICQKADDECRMADDECQMADDECRMADDECQMADDECRMAEGCDGERNNEPMTEESSGPVVGYDSNRVIDDSANDKIGILSHHGAHPAEQPGEGAGGWQCLLESEIPNPESKNEVALPEKAQNKPNLESRKGPESQEIKPETAAAAGQEQTQSREAVASDQWRVASEIEVASGQWSVASEDGGSGELTPQTPSEDGVAGGEWRVASEDRAADNPESPIQNPKSSGILRALLAGGNPLVSTVRGRGPR
jgi:hypothetical protein